MDTQVAGTEVEQQIRLLSLIEPLLRALGTKILAFVTLAMTFGLFCWAMWLQHPLAFAIAGVFGLGVLWPVLFILFKGHSNA
jgi:hypothetical protein